MRLVQLLRVAVPVACILVPVTLAAAGEPVPCETMLEQLRGDKGAEKLSKSDQAKFTALVEKGMERCNADDDTRADQFFAQALKLIHG